MAIQVCKRLRDASGVCPAGAFPLLAEFPGKRTPSELCVVFTCACACVLFMSFRGKYWLARGES